MPREGIATAMARRMAGPTPDGRMPEALLLLLRSSGDHEVDTIRGGFLHSISERMATAATGREPRAGDPALLRAQVLLAAALGITLLRSSLPIQPLGSATEQDLIGPMSDLVSALLPTAGK
jgi:hypothetical protein